jgi:hypothetical protein|eukprot:COSAG01_NODE_3143_length_6519_cov_61.635358_3_plen_197_part_00
MPGATGIVGAACGSDWRCDDDGAMMADGTCVLHAPNRKSRFACARCHTRRLHDSWHPPMGHHSMLAIQPRQNDPPWAFAVASASAWRLPWPSSWHAHSQPDSPPCSSWHRPGPAARLCVGSLASLVPHVLAAPGYRKPAPQTPRRRNFPGDNNGHHPRLTLSTDFHTAARTSTPHGTGKQIGSVSIALPLLPLSLA